jgi:hypothetical protein
MLTLKQIPQLRLKDLNHFSSLYILNITISSLPNLKKVTELKLLQKTSCKNKSFLMHKIAIDHNHKINNNWIALNKILKNYKYVPSDTFYENEETFINTEGFVKRTTKLIQGKQSKNSWQILRKFLRYCKEKITFLAKKNNDLVFFNSKKFYAFKSFLNLHFYAARSLTYLNSYLSFKNKLINLSLFNFKRPTRKITSTKLRYWLDDFFNGNSDEYSQHSKILKHCSKNLRVKFTNFQSP